MTNIVEMPFLDLLAKPNPRVQAAIGAIVAQNLAHTNAEQARKGQPAIVVLAT